MTGRARLKSEQIDSERLHFGEVGQQLRTINEGLWVRSYDPEFGNDSNSLITNKILNSRLTYRG